jgi:hypothetical protein
MSGRLNKKNKKWQEMETEPNKQETNNGAPVAVGMSVAQHLPHRSLRAELPHKAPASVHDANLAIG